MSTKRSRVYIIGVDRKGITVYRDQRQIGVTKSSRKLRSLLGKVTDADVVMFSSSMDFPKEYTTDRKVLALVKKLHRLTA